MASPSSASIGLEPVRWCQQTFAFAERRFGPGMLGGAAVITSSLVAGVLVARLGPAVVGLSLLALIGVGGLIRAREYSLVLLFCLVSGLYTELTFPYYAPAVSIAGNSFQYLDILLLATAAVTVGRSGGLSRAQGGFRLWLILFVLWTATVGVARSLALHVEYHIWVRELRTILWFGFALTLSALLVNRQRVVLTARVLLFTGVVVAAMAAFVRLNHAALAPQTNLLSYQSYGVRIFQVEGVERATYAIALALGLLLVRNRLWLWLVVAANMLTLIVALTRGAYLATFVAAVVPQLALGWKALPRLALRAAILLALVTAAVLVLNTWTGDNVSMGFTDRLMAIDEVSSGSGNVGTRLTEWDVVWSYLQANSDSLIVGVGLGGTFDDPYNMLASDGAEGHLGDARFSYVHNGFLWMILRSGIPGMLLLYGFCAHLIGRCLVLARRTSDLELRGVLLGVAGVYVATFVLSWSGSPLGEGMRMSVLMAYAALGLAAVRLVESR